MEKYYCPYCNPKYQFSKEDNAGNLICGLCGEALIKRQFIKLKQIIATLIALSFILPLIYAFTFLLMDQNNRNRKNYQVNTQFIFLKIIE